ncbi:hypothetical protein GIB67_019645 [Kingdonia uniflora]|uniref:Diacylglycerol O-acyltransferase n=1 Tax=Kingdonia uniflora TaxID=39325 RepID=A0A7J7N0J8_9MAGN|nr:hypothetical protein GIB67_019645 [Kingdonia uniflora]
MKVEVIYEDHVIVPMFAEGLSPMEYDHLCKQYISKIGTEKFPGNRPLWELHLIKYPTPSGASTMVFKLSHAIGDGYSYIWALFNAFRRADDPSLPLTFPPLSFGSKGVRQTQLWSFFSKCKHTVSDFFWSLTAAASENPRSAIRSGSDHLESKPINISISTIPLEKVKEIKSIIGGTVNDVITGLVSYMIHLYMVRMGKISKNGDMTLLVMVNMRALKGYKSIDDMLKANIWGNHSRFLHVKLPSHGEECIDPLQFIMKAKKVMEKKKKSVAIYLIDPILKVLRWFSGRKGLAKFINLNFYNASTMITNVIGPKEKIAMVNQPIGSYYFILMRVPQSLTFTVASSSGDVKVVATMEKGFIDSDVFTACMNEAFKNIYEAVRAIAKT